MTDAFQTLGVVDQLIASGHEAFAYPEIATVTTLISDGAHERNFVLQSTAPSVRQAQRSWVAVPTADMYAIRGYATSKQEVALTEEDGTARNVIVMNFAASQRFVGFWDISALLIETSDPDDAGS